MIAKDVYKIFINTYYTCVNYCKDPDELFEQLNAKIIQSWHEEYTLINFFDKALLEVTGTVHHPDCEELYKNNESLLSTIQKDGVIINLRLSNNTVSLDNVSAFFDEHGSLVFYKGEYDLGTCKWKRSLQYICSLNFPSIQKIKISPLSIEKAYAIYRKTEWYVDKNSQDRGHLNEIEGVTILEDWHPESTPNIGNAFETLIQSLFRKGNAEDTVCTIKVDNVIMQIRDHYNMTTMDTPFLFRETKGIFTLAQDKRLGMEPNPHYEVLRSFIDETNDKDYTFKLNFDKEEKAKYRIIAQFGTDIINNLNLI